MKRSYIVLVLLFFSVLTAGAMDFIAPLDSYGISSDFGYRTDPMGGNAESHLHKGIDLVGPPNAPVKAAADGVVVEHWPAPNGFYKGHPVYGGLVVIDHLDGTHTLYAHMSRTYVSEGDRVKAGRVIGRQGSTGKSTGEHLHFEIIIDPLTVMHSNHDLRLDRVEE